MKFPISHNPFLANGDGYDLGFSRILFYLGMFLFVYNVGYQNLSIPPKILWEQHSFFEIFNLTIPEFDVLRIIVIIWKISLIFSAIGLLGRISMIVSFGLSLYVFGIFLGYIITNFHFYLPTMVMGVLAFSKAHCYVSVDSLISRIRKKGQNFQPKNSENVDYEFGWPRRLILFLIVMMYFSAGISKLRDSGLSWVTDGYLLNHLLIARENFALNSYEWTNPVFSWLVENPDIVNLSGLLVLLIEVTSPVAFLVKKTQIFYFIAWIIFHLVVYLIMGISVSFWYLPILAFFIPWTEISKFISKRKLRS